MSDTYLFRVTIRVRDVHDRMRLIDEYVTVLDALDVDEAAELAQARAASRGLSPVEVIESTPGTFVPQPE